MIYIFINETSIIQDANYAMFQNFLRYFSKKSCIFIKSIIYETLCTIKQTLFTSVFPKGLI